MDSNSTLLESANSTHAGLLLHEVLSSTTAQVILAIFVCFLLFQVVLFPFYVLVNRANRKRDEKTSVFPFITVFYRITSVTITSFVAMISSFLFVFILFKLYGDQGIFANPNGSMKGVFIVLTLLFGYSTIMFLICAMFNSAVCNLLTAILAFHRFLLFFFPRVGDFLTPNKLSMKVLLGILYAVVFCEFALSFYEISKDPRGNNKHSSDLFSDMKSRLFITSSALLITIPYSIMFLSIRKLTTLASKLQSKPEKYIAYQVVLVFINKLFTICYYLLLPYSPHHPATMSLGNVFDAFTTPLSIELAYLLSNKSNVDTLFRIFTRKLMFWKRHYRVENETVVATTYASASA